MLLAGARTSTATELSESLGYDAAGFSTKDAQDAYHDILTKQRSNHNGYDLDVANSMWIEANFNVSSAFEDTIKNTYYAEVKEVTFGSQQATDQINSWVSEETHGKIPKLFDSPLDAETRLVLANAMYFKGTWVTQFDKSLTADYPFKNNGVNSKNTKMMNIVSNFPYYDSSELNAELLALPYKGNDVNMVIVLPKTDNGLANLQSQLTLAKLKTAFSKLQTTKVHVKVPKFDTSSSLNLIDVLKSLGIQSAFSSSADLSGIDGKRDLYVSEAIQKAIIEVSEEGTVAAAATGLGMSDMAMMEPPPKEIYFTADHPFFYFIHHKPSDVCLFFGSLSQV